MNPTAICILAVVFLLIMVRRIGRFKLPIWGIMACGAVAALIFQTISLESAIASIKIDVILFLFGMFVFGSALDASGLLRRTVIKGFSNAKTKRHVLLIFMLTTAAASALFMNDTVAVIAAPIAIFCGAKFEIPVIKMLLALCFAVTFGSAITPIGNPQNLLIALTGVSDAFVTYALYLAAPSIVCLIFSALFLSRGLSDTKATVPARCRGELIDDDIGLVNPVADKNLSRLCKISFVGIVIVVAARLVCSFVGFELSFLWIAAVAALPLLLFSKQRFSLLKSVDYSTLVFFAAMFILMEAVWESGVLQFLLPAALTTSVPVMVAAGCILSQFVSNVPFVLMVLPLLEASAAPVAMYMAASAGCTAAGTLTILGAASTIIVIQHAEKEGETISFFTYLKEGAAVTMIAVVMYSVWILGVGAVVG